MEDFCTTGVCDVMVFRPTWDEFQDFQGYMQHIEDVGAAKKCGIAKIVPPKEWSPRPVRGLNYEEMDDMVVQAPIQQKIQGEQGCYTQFNMVYKKQMTVKEYRKLANSREYAPPLFEDYADMERKYWKNIKFRSPIYGADFHGTLYDVNEVKVWNINRLPSILDMLKDMSEAPLEGVNNAYMYFGMFKATFPWHTEDMDLYSINYIHYGASKFWYGISDLYRTKFERLAKSLFPQSAKQCPSFLRHKMYLISPSVLRQNGIPYGTMLHNQGEFIITFPGGYHAGFNCGFNAAESTNFALERWIDFGKTADYCECEEDTVRIDMEPFLRKYRTEQDVQEYLSQFKGTKKIKSSGSKMCVPKLNGKRQPTAKEPKQNVKRRRKERTKEHSQTTQIIESIKEKDKELFADDASTSSGISVGSGGEEERPLSEASISSPDGRLRAKPDVGDLFAGENRWSRLWQWKMYDFDAEKEYNKEEGLLDPHCCVCQSFIPKSLLRRKEKVPRTSRKLVSELCYSRNPIGLLKAQEGLKEEIGHQTEEDTLLTCTDCSVTVHARCYGETRPEFTDRKAKDLLPGWQCSRCAEAEEPHMVDCKFCCLRGGALQMVKDGEWAHIICTLYNEKAKFLDPVRKRPIVITPADEKIDEEEDTAFQCEVCHGDNGFTIGCSHHECGPNYFHATCAKAIGASFEFRDFPLLVALICTSHDQLEADGLGSVDVGESVICWLEEGTIVRRGVILSFKEYIFAVVDFDDGSFSSNLYLEDIKECSCGDCHGSHTSGSRVKVLWSDTDVYYGYFRRAYPAKTYTVKLDNGMTADCRREELYGHKEIVPETVLERLGS